MSEHRSPREKIVLPRVKIRGTVKEGTGSLLVRLLSTFNPGKYSEPHVARFRLKQIIKKLEK